MPKKWWQWILIYPTLLISLSANIPNAITAFKAYQNDMSINQVEHANEQHQLWEDEQDSTCSQWR